MEIILILAPLILLVIALICFAIIDAKTSKIKNPIMTISYENQIVCTMEVFSMETGKGWMWVNHGITTIVDPLLYEALKRYGSIELTSIGLFLRSQDLIYNITIR